MAKYRQKLEKIFKYENPTNIIYESKGLEEVLVMAYWQMISVFKNGIWLIIFLNFDNIYFKSIL